MSKCDCWWAVKTRLTLAEIHEWIIHFTEMTSWLKYFCIQSHICVLTFGHYSIVKHFLFTWFWCFEANLSLNFRPNGDKYPFCVQIFTLNSPLFWKRTACVAFNRIYRLDSIRVRFNSNVLGRSKFHPFAMLCVFWLFNLWFCVTFSEYFQRNLLQIASK